MSIDMEEIDTDSRMKNSFKFKRATTTFLYSILLIGGALLSSPFTAVAASMETLSPVLLISEINLASSAYSFAGLISGFFSSLVIDTIGRKYVNILVGLLFTLGCVLRLAWLDWTKPPVDHPEEIVGNFNWVIYG
jgi:MFS family permease